MKKTMMIRCLLAVTTGLAASSPIGAAAAVPGTITHQGRLYDANNQPVNGSVSVVFALYDSPTAVTPIWTETHTGATAVTCTDGYYSVEVGSVTPFCSAVAGACTAVTFDGSVRYFGMKVGSDAEMSPRAPMTSVAYALLANDVNGDIHPTSVTLPSTGSVRSPDAVGVNKPGNSVTIRAGFGTGTALGGAVRLQVGDQQFQSGSTAGLSRTLSLVPIHADGRYELQDDAGRRVLGFQPENWASPGLGTLSLGWTGQAYFSGMPGVIGVQHGLPWATPNLYFGYNSAGGSNLLRMNVSDLTAVTSEFSLGTYRVADLQNSPALAFGASSFRFVVGNAVPGGSPVGTVAQGNGFRVEAIHIDSSGNVGIGTSTPTNILTVKQNAPTSPIADAWTTYSSRRWKTNIQTIEGALDKVQRLRGVYYDWKANGKRDIGLIAEEVGEVIPEVVVYEENGNDARSVDYPRLVSVLIQATKEQQARLTEQQAQITALESRLTALEGRRR